LVFLDETIIALGDKEVAQAARKCSESVAMMQIVVKLLGRDLAVGYRPVR